MSEFNRQAVVLAAKLMVLAFGIVIFSAPLRGKSQQSPEQESTRFINLLLCQYAVDHDGHYPDGASSTEVFQKFLDDKYVTDPGVFYLPLPGKIKAQPGQKLKPENVCFDVTGGVSSTDSQLLPVVFMTGLKIAYGPDATATFLKKPEPRYYERTWKEWWDGQATGQPRNLYVYVSYLGNSTVGFIVSEPATSNGMIPHFISPSFNAGGKTYRQLTPDGPLP